MTRNTRRWCRGKEGVDHLPRLVRRRPDDRPCNRVEDWRDLLARDDPQSNIRWWNAPWECFHSSICDRCGKVLIFLTDLAWDCCPDLPLSPEGRELLAVRDEPGR